MGSHYPVLAAPTLQIRRDDVLWGPMTPLRCFGVPPPRPGCLHPPNIWEGGIMGCCAPLTPQTSKLEAVGVPSTPFAFPTPLGCHAVQRWSWHFSVCH